MDATSATQQAIVLQDVPTIPVNGLYSATRPARKVPRLQAACHRNVHPRVLFPPE